MVNSYSETVRTTRNLCTMTSIRLPVWLEAQNELTSAMLELPAKTPRPEELISPHTEADLEAWSHLEASKRAILDEAVRKWLSHREWPASLDPTDGWLLTVRIRAAKDWLALGAIGAVHSDHPATLMQMLLIEGWAECFLEHHLGQLRYRQAMYFRGHANSGGFSE